MTQATRKIAGLQVAEILAKFVEDEALPGSGVTRDAFWQGLAGLVERFAGETAALLKKRDEMQAKIDAWHKAQRAKPFDAAAYEAFLREIGYLAPPASGVAVAPANVDAEIATICGPQLVVPLSNARYALNAANARWGSLYDALYGTDALPAEAGPKAAGYDPARGAKVIATAKGFLDQAAPLANGHHADATAYAVKDGKLAVTLADGSHTGLKDSAKFAGYNGTADAPTAILLKNNGLHAEIVVDRSHAIGGRAGELNPPHD